MKDVITVKAWKRPGRLKKVLDALYSNEHIEEFDVYVFIDPSPKDAEHRKLMANYDCTWTMNEKKRGCAGNTKECFRVAFDVHEAEFMVHLEDDSVPAPDFLSLMLWAKPHLETTECLFSVGGGRPKRELGYQGLPKERLEDVVLIDSFACQFGWGMVRRVYEEMKEAGGIFGAIGNVSVNLEPNAWKKQVQLGPNGSWAWPFNKFFKRGRQNLIPYINRAQNIGDSRGVFTPSPQWHMREVFTKTWTGALEQDEISHKFNLCETES